MLALGQPVALHSLVAVDVVMTGLKSHMVDLEHVLVVLGYQEPALHDIVVGNKGFQRCLGLFFCN